MDKKILAIALVVLVAAVVVVTVVSLDNEETVEKESKGVGRLLVYGNVDNDDYLDEDDLAKLKSIVNEGQWDKNAYPFADVNYDSAVDEDDIKYLEKLLNKEKALMYYIGTGSKVFAFHYPAADKEIAVSSDYGMMMAQVLGCYDKITAGAGNRVLTQSESRYPGCHSFTDLGNWSRGDTATFVENVLKSDCQILMGQLSQTAYDMFQESKQEVDMVMLSPSAEISQYGHDVVSSILTCGVLLDCGDKAREYSGYCDKMTEVIAEKTKGLETLTFVQPYNTNNAVTTTVHTTDAPNGAMTGVIWTLSHFPMKSDVKWNELDTNGRSLNVEIEEIIKLNPDVIILSGWNKLAADEPPEKGQAAFDEMGKYFSETEAYKNGRVYAVTYEVYGTYLGVGGLGLLGSYLYPDAFSEEEGWDMLQEAIDKFTMMKGDIKQMGGVIPYKVNCTA